MNCKKTRLKMSELIDGVLAPAEERAVLAHTASCPECRRELELLKKTVALVRGLPQHDPPVELPGKIRARLQGSAPGQGRVSRLFWVRTAAAAAVLLFLGVYGFILVETPRRALSEKDAVRAPTVGQKEFYESVEPPAPEQLAAPDYMGQDAPAEAGLDIEESRAVSLDADFMDGGMARPFDAMPAAAPAPAEHAQGDDVETGAGASTAPSAAADRRELSYVDLDEEASSPGSDAAPKTDRTDRAGKLKSATLSEPGFGAYPRSELPARAKEKTITPDPIPAPEASLQPAPPPPPVAATKTGSGRGREKPIDHGRPAFREGAASQREAEGRIWDEPVSKVQKPSMPVAPAKPARPATPAAPAAPRMLSQPDRMERLDRESEEKSRAAREHAGILPRELVLEEADPSAVASVLNRYRSGPAVTDKALPQAAPGPVRMRGEANGVAAIAADTFAGGAAQMRSAAGGTRQTEREFTIEVDAAQYAQLLAELRRLGRLSALDPAHLLAPGAGAGGTERFAVKIVLRPPQ